MAYITTTNTTIYGPGYISQSRKKQLIDMNNDVVVASDTKDQS